MVRYLFLVLLLALGACSHRGDYFVSPPIPPTAFVGEYYTVQFRVLGLDNPVFKFEDMPDCFKGHSDGTVEGTPKTPGTYEIKVWFASKGVKECKVLSIRVSASVSLIQKTTPEAITAVNDFIVVNPRESLTYLVGDKIDLSLRTEHGKGPFKWNYLNLPAELTAGADGIIRGVFEKEGYYSFEASATDAEGHFADCYFTFNVQPQKVRESKPLVMQPLP
jgi:hypothetical protein